MSKQHCDPLTWEKLIFGKESANFWDELKEGALTRGGWIDWCCPRRRGGGSSARRAAFAALEVAGDGKTRNDLLLQLAESAEQPPLIPKFLFHPSVTHLSGVITNSVWLTTFNKYVPLGSFYYKNLFFLQRWKKKNGWHWLQDIKPMCRCAPQIAPITPNCVWIGSSKMMKQIDFSRSM